MTALRASENPDLVVAVFEKSTREGCNAAISSGMPGRRGHPLPARGRHRRLPERHAARHPGRQRRRGVATRRGGALRGRSGGTWNGSPTRGYPIEIGVDLPRAGHVGAAAALRPRPAGWWPADAPPAARCSTRGRTSPSSTRRPRSGCCRGRGGDRRWSSRRTATRRGRPGRCDRARRRRVRRQPAAGLGTPLCPRRSVLRRRRHEHRGRAAVAHRARRPAAQPRRRLRSGLVVVGHGTRVSPGLPFIGAVLVNQTGRALRRRGGARLLVPVRASCSSSPTRGPRWSGTRPPWRSPASRR